MALLTAHLLESGDHGRLGFHPGCAVCRDERLFGRLPPDAVVSLRARAALASGVLAVSAAGPPATALAQEQDQRLEGVTAPLPPGPAPGENPGLDPGAETGLPGESMPPAPPAPPASEPGTPSAPPAGADPQDVVPVESEPVQDPVPPEPAPDLELTEPPTEAAPGADPAEPAAPIDSVPDDPIFDAGDEQPPPTEDRAAPRDERPERDADRRADRDDADRKSHGGAPAPLRSPGATPPPTDPIAAPAAAEVAASPATPEVPDVVTSPIEGRAYVVEPGDSLWTIAKRLLGPDASVARIAREVDRLWSLNADRIGTGDPDLLMVGTKLRLR